jgi:hypothetical protein
MLKLDTEDVLLQTLTFSNAESTVDQIKMINPLKLMLDAQEHHGDQTSSRLDLNSRSPEKDGSTERVKMDNGDQSPPTTSGTITTVLKSSVKASAMVRVLEPKPETTVTEKALILNLDTEDVLLQTLTFSNAESTVDQIKTIDPLMLM